MTYLLDVNVLIALMDPAHVDHERAHAWFDATGRHSWASCPITESGVMRVLGNRRYPNSPGTPASAARMLEELCSLSGHVFWADDISPVDERRFDTARLLSAGQVTDSYLLGVAVAHEGQLATFDRRLIPDAVRDGPLGLHWIASEFSPA